MLLYFIEIFKLKNYNSIYYVSNISNIICIETGEVIKK